MKLLNYKLNNTCIQSLLLITLAYTVSLSGVYAQQIIPDGYTNTNLNIENNVTTVTTQTIKGSNAFNSFSKFNVNEGNVVNLIVPGQAENLLNVIKNEATHIDGTLNALKNGELGGNVFLINPYGVMVSSSGVVNVGALTTVTPAKDFVDNFFNSPGNPDDASVSAVLNGTAPDNPDAQVIINGVINAAYSENSGLQKKPDMADIVNLGNMEEMESFIVDKGVVNPQPPGDSTLRNTLSDKISSRTQIPGIPIPPPNKILGNGAIDPDPPQDPTIRNLIKNGVVDPRTPQDPTIRNTLSDKISNRTQIPGIPIPPPNKILGDGALDPDPPSDPSIRNLIKDVVVDPGPETDPTMKYNLNQNGVIITIPLPH